MSDSNQISAVPWAPLVKQVLRGAMFAVAWVALGAGCGGGYNSASRTALDTVSRSGGDMSFRLVDEGRHIRRDIEDHLGSSLLAVSLDGPNADGLTYIGEVKAGCFPNVRYRFRGSRPYEEVHQARTASSDGVSSVLTAGMVGADGSTQEESSIRLVSVGTYISEGGPRGPSRVPGCETATHVLTKVEVGAMEWRVADARAGSGSLGVGAVGVESDQQQQSGSLVREGIVRECQRMSSRATRPPDGCRVPLRAKVDPLPRMAFDARLAGTYVCGGKNWATRMALHVTATGEVTGQVIVAHGDLVGRWGLAGTMTGTSVSLAPAEPFEVPFPYSPVGFAGKLTSQSFDGEVDTCGAVRLVADPSG